MISAWVALVAGARGHSGRMSLFGIWSWYICLAVFIQFDTLGRPDGRLGGVDDGKVARGIVELIEAGYADRVLLSQDVCNKIQLKKYGGTGFSYVLENFLPALRDLGVEEEDIHKMMVENPVRALTFAAPVPSL